MRELKKQVTQFSESSISPVNLWHVVGVLSAIAVIVIVGNEVGFGLLVEKFSNLTSIVQDSVIKSNKELMHSNHSIASKILGVLNSQSINFTNVSEQLVEINKMLLRVFSKLNKPNNNSNSSDLNTTTSWEPD